QRELHPAHRPIEPAVRRGAGGGLRGHDVAGGTRERRERAGPGGHLQEVAAGDLVHRRHLGAARVDYRTAPTPRHRARRAPVRWFSSPTMTAAFLISVALLTQASPTAVEPAGILITRQLAERRGLTVGSVVRLATDPAGAHARLFRVDGIYEPTPDPMHFAQPQLDARM